MEISVTFIY